MLGFSQIVRRVDSVNKTPKNPKRIWMINNFLTFCGSCCENHATKVKVQSSFRYMIVVELN